MTLDDLIATLEGLPADDTIRCGELVSWRGVYAELTLDPRDDERVVGDVLGEARRVLAGEQRQGWKGGDYTYAGRTPVWADPPGECNYDTLTGVAMADGAWRLVTSNIAEYR